MPFEGGTSTTGTWSISQDGTAGVVTYPSKLDLLKYDVYYEDTSKDIFVVKNIPEYFTFGKHTIFLGYRDTLEALGYGLRVGSDILMEVTDSVGNIIFSQLISNKISSTTMTDSGFGAVYIRIDRNPDRTFNFIQDGIGHITLLGELDGNIPQEWKGHYNCRFVQEIEIRKDLPNKSSLYFEDYPTIQATTTTADESTLGTRSGVPSVLKVYNHQQYDNLHTVGGKLDTIEASFQSDANDLSGSNPTTLIDNFKVQPVELLTVSGNLYHKDTTWIGQNVNRNIYDTSGKRAIFENSWTNGASDSRISHAAGNSDHRGLEGAHSIGSFYGNYEGFPDHINDSYIVKYFRKTVTEEKFTIRYNISGSGGVIVKASTSGSYELTPAGDGNSNGGGDGWPGKTFSYDTGSGATINYLDTLGFLPEDSDSIVTLYSASFNDFNPQLMSGSIVNGTLVSSQSFNLSQSIQDDQIIQGNFTAPSDAYVAVYLINNVTQSYADMAITPAPKKCYWNNISIKHQELDDMNPPVYYRTLNINAGSQRSENHIYTARFLNSNSSFAQDLNYSNQEITSSLVKEYIAEGMWIERGLGSGYSPSPTQKIQVAGKFTNVASSSQYGGNIYSSSVGIIGEATSDEQWDGLGEQYPGPYRADNGSGDARGITVGVYGLAVRASQSAYNQSKGPPKAIGVWGQAVDSGSNGDDGPSDQVYSGYFNLGQFYVGDKFHLSGSYNQTGDMNIGGDINVIGDITAQNYIVSSSVTYLTESFASGSHVFGNTPDDTHQFTGSLYISGGVSIKGSITASGDISSSGTIHASTFTANGVTAVTGMGSQLTIGGSGTPLFTNSHITASNNISASGNLYGSELHLNDLIISGTSGGDIHFQKVEVGDSYKFLGTDGKSLLQIKDMNQSANGIKIEQTVGGTNLTTPDTDHDLLIKTATGDSDLILQGGIFITGSSPTDIKVGIGVTTPVKELTVSGSVSASGDLYGNGITAAGSITSSGAISASSIIADSNLTSSFHSIFTETSITASGNISASGNIYADGIKATLPSGTDPSVVILDSDGFLKTDEVDDKIFDNVIGASGGGLFGSGNDLKYLYIDDGSNNTTDAGNLSNTTTGAKLVGSLTASGQISASKIIADANLTSSFHSLYAETSITASGNISSSGDLYGNSIFFAQNIADDYIGYVNNEDVIFMSSQDINIYPAVNGGVGIGQAHTHNNTSKLEVNGNIFTNSHITASGQISASKIIADANLTSSFHSIYAETSVSASGNISASGIYYGKQREHTYHQFDEPSDALANFIPAPGAYVIEGTTINYYRKWLAPYDGNLIKCIIYAENDPDNTRLSLYLNGSYQARKTVAMDAATPATFDMTDMDGSALNDDSSFSAGDLISIAMDPANAPGEVNLVCTWEYKIID